MIFSPLTGWRECPRPIEAEVPGWATVWHENTVDPEFEHVFGIHARREFADPEGRFLHDLWFPRSLLIRLRFPEMMIADRCEQARSAALRLAR